MKLQSFVWSYIFVSINFSLRRLEHSEKIRTFIFQEQQQTLDELYGRGMTSTKGKQCQTLKQEAVVKTGLPVDVILNWIGNHRKTVRSAEEICCPKTLYERRMTGYNQFVHENKDDVGAMASWPESWQVFPEISRLQYKSRAREFQPECDKKKKRFCYAEKSWENAQ